MLSKSIQTHSFYIVFIAIPSPLALTRYFSPRQLTKPAISSQYPTIGPVMTTFSHRLDMKTMIHRSSSGCTQVPTTLLAISRGVNTLWSGRNDQHKMTGSHTFFVGDWSNHQQGGVAPVISWWRRSSTMIAIATAGCWHADRLEPRRVGSKRPRR